MSSKVPQDYRFGQSGIFRQVNKLYQSNDYSASKFKAQKKRLMSAKIRPNQAGITRLNQGSMVMQNLSRPPSGSNQTNSTLTGLNFVPGKSHALKLLMMSHNSGLNM
jgi:hypothetical protein